MRLFAYRIYQISSKIKAKHAANFELLQLNIFEKRDLMALLRGDPPFNKFKSDKQLTLF